MEEGLGESCIHIHLALIQIVNKRAIKYVLMYKTVCVTVRYFWKFCKESLTILFVGLVKKDLLM